MYGIYTPGTDEYGIRSFVYRAAPVSLATLPRLDRQRMVQRGALEGLLLAG
ncbi:MAG: hypothetical protein V3Q69_11810 [Burkholderia sp.]